jgi:hypothetical protein
MSVFARLSGTLAAPTETPAPSVPTLAPNPSDTSIELPREPQVKDYDHGVASGRGLAPISTGQAPLPATPAVSRPCTWRAYVAVQRATSPDAPTAAIPHVWISIEIWSTTQNFRHVNLPRAPRLFGKAPSRTRPASAQALQNCRSGERIPATHRKESGHGNIET